MGFALSNGAAIEFVSSVLYEPVRHVVSLSALYRVGKKELEEGKTLVLRFGVGLLTMR